MENFRLYGIGQ